MGRTLVCWSHRGIVGGFCGSEIRIEWLSRDPGVWWVSGRSRSPSPRRSLGTHLRYFGWRVFGWRVLSVAVLWKLLPLVCARPSTCFSEVKLTLWFHMVFIHHEDHPFDFGICSRKAFSGREESMYLPRGLPTSRPHPGCSQGPGRHSAPS